MKYFEEIKRLREGLEAKHLDGLNVSQRKKDLIWSYSEAASFETCSYNEGIEAIKKTYTDLASLLKDD